MTTESSPAVAPAPVRNAHLLWLLVAALGLVSTVLSEIADPTTVSGDVPSIAIYVLAAVFILAVLGLIVLFARKMLVGRNWARIVLLVFGVLSLLSLVTSFDEFGGGALAVAGSVLSLLGDIAAIVAVVLSFLPAANPWFRRS